jgi:hypothetical protein
VAPLTKEYPDLTPYQFASNTPVQAIDLDGLEAAYVNQSNINSINTNLLERQNVVNKNNSDLAKYCETYPTYSECNKSRTVPTLGLWTLNPVKNIFEVRDHILKNGAPPVVYIQHHALDGRAAFSGDKNFDMTGTLREMSTNSGNKSFDEYDLAYYIHTEIDKKPAKDFSYKVTDNFVLKSRSIVENGWETKKLEIDAIYTIAQKIPDGGTLILAGCRYAEANGKKVFVALSQFNTKISFIGNVKLTGSFCIDYHNTTRANNGENNGWMEYKNGVLINNNFNLKAQSDTNEPLNKSKPKE